MCIPVVCIAINLTSLCNGFSLKPEAGSVFTQDYMSDRFYSSYMGVGLISKREVLFLKIGLILE